MKGPDDKTTPWRKKKGPRTVKMRNKMSNLGARRNGLCGNGRDGKAKEAATGRGEENVAREREKRRKEIRRKKKMGYSSGL